MDLLCITVKDAREKIAKYIDHYNRVSLHSAINYLRPEDYLLVVEKEKIAIREEKLAKALKNRAEYWRANEAA